jgi:Arc/MetJ-type ribon-helix-helix transcriptional regulator
MIPEYQGQIAFRLSETERQQIEQLVKKGKFKTVSQVVRAALTEFLSKGEELCREPSTLQA